MKTCSGDECGSVSAQREVFGGWVFVLDPELLSILSMT